MRLSSSKTALSSLAGGQFIVRATPERLCERLCPIHRVFCDLRPISGIRAELGKYRRQTTRNSVNIRIETPQIFWLELHLRHVYASPERSSLLVDSRAYMEFGVAKPSDDRPVGYVLRRDPKTLAVVRYWAG